MTRREVGFLLIGLGAGLVLAVLAIVEFVFWFHHMFTINNQWSPASVVLALPLLLVLIGAAFLLRRKSPPDSN